MKHWKFQLYETKVSSAISQFLAVIKKKRQYYRCKQAMMTKTHWQVLQLETLSLIPNLGSMHPNGAALRSGI
jgi:hypothetical protein